MHMLCLKQVCNIKIVSLKGILRQEEWVELVVIEN